MKVESSPRSSPTSATDRREGMRFAYTWVGRPSTSSVTTSNIPPGPVSWARTSALVGMAGDRTALDLPGLAARISDDYCPSHADERGRRVVDPLLHAPRRPPGGADAPRRSARRVPRRAARLPGQGPPVAG